MSLFKERNMMDCRCSSDAHTHTRTHGRAHTHTHTRSHRTVFFLSDLDQVKI